MEIRQFVYLCQPKKEALRIFFPELSIFQSNPEVYDEIPPMQLFVPDRFIFGHFVNMERDFLVLSGSLYFTDNHGNLQKYLQGYERNKIEIKRAYDASPNQVNDLHWKIRLYKEYRKGHSNEEVFGFRPIPNQEYNLIGGLLNLLDEGIGGIYIK